ncbi:MAG: hypothetical protein KGJ13_05430 [Patescibacteria group bacterium]|nr:hypothetical protein [Patescibacteria group bacterium]
MLNWAIIKLPLNWFTVFLMTVIGVFLLNVILHPFHIPQNNTTGLSPNSEPSPTLATTQ